MKLLFCELCHDVVRLNYHWKSCECGESCGRYLDDGINAEIWGPCLPLGFANSSFTEAVRNQPTGDQGLEFTAFVIPEPCKTVTVLNRKPKEQRRANVKKSSPGTTGPVAGGGSLL